MLLSTGERISCALCAMAIHDLGSEAISLSGSQAGIVTDTSHTKARILDVRADRIRAGARGGQDRAGRRLPGRLDRRQRRDDARPRRLRHDRGRAGGRARRRGLRDLHRRRTASSRADPRIVPDARKLPVVSFEEMLEMAASGRKVLQLRSVEYARNYGVRIHVPPSFGDGSGTLVSAKKRRWNDPLVTAVTHSDRRRPRHAHRRPRPARHRRPHLRRARRGRRQRRHDHPERAGLRPTTAPRSRSPSPKDDLRDRAARARGARAASSASAT